MLAALKWGDVPGWVEAIGTIGAFATGGWLLVREIRRGRQLEDEHRRDQASRVWAWIDFVPVIGLPGQAATGVAGQATAEPHLVAAAAPRATAMAVCVRNGSDLPVYDCVVMFIERAAGTHLATEDVGLILPGETEARAVPQRVLNSLERPSLHLLWVDAFFFDAGRRRWHRTWRGELRELPPVRSDQPVRRRFLRLPRRKTRR